MHPEHALLVGLDYQFNITMVTLVDLVDVFEYHRVESSDLVNKHACILIFEGINILVVKVAWVVNVDLFLAVVDYYGQRNLLIKGVESWVQRRVSVGFILFFCLELNSGGVVYHGFELVRRVKQDAAVRIEVIFEHELTAPSQLDLMSISN